MTFQGCILLDFSPAIHGYSWYGMMILYGVQVTSIQVLGARGRGLIYTLCSGLHAFLKLRRTCTVYFDNNSNYFSMRYIILTSNYSSLSRANLSSSCTCSSIVETLKLVSALTLSHFLSACTAKYSPGITLSLQVCLKSLTK